MFIDLWINLLFTDQYKIFISVDRSDSIDPTSLMFLIFENIYKCPSIKNPIYLYFLLSNSFLLVLIVIFIILLIFFDVFYSNKLINFDYLRNFMIFSFILKKKKEGFLFLRNFLLNHSFFFSIGLLIIIIESMVIKTNNYIYNNYFIFIFHDFFFFDLIICTLFFYIVLFFIIYSDFKEKRSYISYEVIIILWFSILSCVCLLYVYNLIYIFLCLEILSLTFYIAILNKGYTLLPLEASVKYYIMSALSSALFLLGLCLIYLLLGTFNLYEIFILGEILRHKIDYTIYFLSSFLIFLSLYFKQGLAPFHSWVPTVYGGSNIIFVIFISLIPKITYLAIIIKFIYFFNIFTFDNYKFFLFIVVSVLSLIIGTFGALNQFKIKRFLAYSSISQMSYIFLTLLASNYILSFFFSFFYLFIYIFISFNIFIILIIFFSNDNLNVYSLKFSFFNKKFTLISLVWVFSFLSLAGIPPFSGFFSKFLILKLILDSEYFLLFLFILLFSSISIYYYLRFIIFSFFIPTISLKKNKNNIYKNFSINNSLILYILFYFFLINIFFIFFFDDFLNVLYLLFFKLLLF